MTPLLPCSFLVPSLTLPDPSLPFMSPALSSWVPVPPDSEFSLSNLPLGVYVLLRGSNDRDDDGRAPSRRRVATRLGDTIIDLGVLESAMLFAGVPGLNHNVFNRTELNAFVAHPKPVWRAFRRRLTALLRDSSTQVSDGDTAIGDDEVDDRLRRDSALQRAAFISYDPATLIMHLPIRVNEYTDFYSSREHATNVGTMFRGANNALQPNWLYLPVGYHGRASTIVVSGTPVRRPNGQLAKDSTNDAPGSVHGPSRRLDIELEVATIVGGPPNDGQRPLTVAEAKDRIFGYVLSNDWSARDLQKWEYVPLGPFTSKNFATSVSPWIVMADALDDACEKCPPSAVSQVDPVPLPYLQDPDYATHSIGLQVALQPASSTEAAVICRSNFRNLYWTPAQQLAHHSVSGCVMRPGDLLGSGTISGTAPDSFGSLLELSWNGSRPVKVGVDGANGGQDVTRTFLNDGDTVTLTGVCLATKRGHGRIGFGECSGTILPALPLNNSAVSDGATSPATTTASLPIDACNRYRNFRLYGFWRSSSTWRVRIQLAAKGVAYENVPVNLSAGEHRTADFLSKNPAGQVPVLEVEDSYTDKIVRLSQSVAIGDFLDAVFHNRYLMQPKDPLDRAIALELVETINAGIQPLQNVFYLQRLQDESEGRVRAEDEARNVIQAGLKTFEALLDRHMERLGGGPYCLGAFAPTVVDAYLVPQMFNARRFGVPVDSLCPMLAAIERVCLEHPWFQHTHPDCQPDAERT
jgi:fumarylacetoacetase